MEITENLLIELQNRLKVGSRRGVHLNAIPARSKYKFDITRLLHIDEKLPANFINSLLTELPLKFKITWKDNVLRSDFILQEKQLQLIKIIKSFEDLINQTDAIESEKGINTFGFGYPILVRRDQADNKLTVAPLLIWSLRIKRTKEFNTWEILRAEDDPIYINEVLINHLQSDSKIEIDQISTELLDKGWIDKSNLLDICTDFIKAINTSVPANIRKTFEENYDKIKAISDKKYYESLPLASNNSFIDFAGLFSIFEVQKQNIIQDYDKLLESKGSAINLEKMEEHSFQPISSVETDPSQQGILHALNSSRNILIQGPPGTGKSQTLTAVLVNALENKKKTIIVCEKRTALEVLHNALTERGLGKQCILLKDIIKDRRAVVDSVRDRIDVFSQTTYGYEYSKELLDNIIRKLKTLIDSINNQHKKTGEKLIGNKNWTDIVGALLAELKDNTEEYQLDLERTIFSYESSELNRLLEIIRKGQELYFDFKPFVDISFINTAKLVGDNPFVLEQQIEENFSAYKKSLELLFNQIMAYESQYYKIRTKQFEEQQVAIKKAETAIQNILKKHEENKDFLDEEKTNGFLYKMLSFFSKKRKIVRKDQEIIAMFFEKFSLLIKSTKDFEAVNFANVIKENKAILEDYKLIIEKNNLEFQSKIEAEYQSKNLLKTIKNEFNTELLKTIKADLTSLKTTIEEQNWTANQLDADTHEELIAKIQKIISLKERFFEHENDLFSIEFKWFQFYNFLSIKEQELLSQLKEKKDWRKAFLIFYLNSILVGAANMDLPTDDKDHVELSKSLSGLGKNQIGYIKDYWHSKEVDAVKNFETNHPEITVENLYNKRSGKRYKRLSLREIVRFDLDLFTTFFPVILTTPDVASNLFKGQNQYFDIVMFDEASQLKLEDNLPALLKGKQIIIAGDEHQMPPSNYFSKIFDGGIDDENEEEEDDEIEVNRIKNSITNSLSDCESLLDFASELGFEKQYLDVHYRSKHPYLIDYSNYAFYNQRLKPLPNNFEYTPITYVPVNGIYSNTCNEAEAETVLSIIDKNISRLPNGAYPTIGVATFNINQRNLILSKINERRKYEEYSDFNNKIIELEENGFFVKNLENIQGDERDVIILSTTYGITKDGKFAQRFGSVNHQKGYKLLNVIVTRAKYKIYVCSSIPEEVFLNYREHLIKEDSNNRKGALYAYLAYSKAVSEQDEEARISILNTLAENSSQKTSINNFDKNLESPFEEEVYEILTTYFDKKNITAQFQFAGFRIDIVYDPKRIGLPKIAIECDGAAYHSSQEAYLHDKHRQEILEAQGFVFHRIWSTNWWRNPQRETEKLVEFIKNIENKNPSFFEDKTKISLAFTDDVTIPDNEDFELFLTFKEGLGAGVAPDGKDTL